MAPAPWPVFALLAACALLSASLSALAIGYAHRRRLFDLPGRRRSHAQATPRGGGIGIVVCVIAASLVFWPNRVEAAALASALALVGLVGWIDDHRGLAARWRLLAHALAAGILLVAFRSDLSERAADWLAFAGVEPNAALGTLALLLIGVWLVWSVNLHNFMDGIDGILAMQALFVFAVAVVAFAHAGTPPEAIGSAVCLAATCGFLPFNFPRARVFMGDVGSGVLGLLLGLILLGLSLHPRLAAGSGLVAGSAFLIDATCTLLMRIAHGRRWYSAHREHLYQWLVRIGFSHARVVAFYMGWNLLIVMPTLWWINRADAQDHGGLVTAALLVLGVVAWHCGKRWCLKVAGLESSRAAA
ncbi:glycosyl transferase family 4 [Dokdonella sp.]|uniref:glycosyl transferase family 4 n=1 Tax=Dokdonella sp. TaxID=2291710 RepID=UPI0025C2FF54|nr:glycosyl transferase family 4 [Dokdonella sp.]